MRVEAEGCIPFVVRVEVRVEAEDRFSFVVRAEVVEKVVVLEQPLSMVKEDLKVAEAELEVKTPHALAKNMLI